MQRTRTSFSLGRIGLGLALSALVACGGDDGDGSGDLDAAVDLDAPGPVAVSKRDSKSGTIAVSNDDTRVLMVNPEKDSVSLFDTATDTRIAEIPTGGEPSSVVVHPDDDVAFVANRADATVVKITGLKGTSPGGRHPARRRLRAHRPGAVAHRRHPLRRRVRRGPGRGDRHRHDDRDAPPSRRPSTPRALTVTNDGDQDDDDELIVVPEFFGEVGPGEEATDGAAQRPRPHLRRRRPGADHADHAGARSTAASRRRRRRWARPP